MLLSTPGHKIYSDGEYQSASELTTSSELLSSDGKHLHPSSVSNIDSTATVYNFEVSDYHNYYAGDAKVLVHNECAWVGIKQILVNSNKIELFDKFHDAVHALNIGSSERKLLFTSIANLGDNASKFILDFIDSPSKLSKFAKEAGLVEAWGCLAQNPKLRLKSANLESISKWIKEGSPADEIAITLASSKSKTKFI
ncbi:MAG: HINT domain-containing protein, partial [Marinifilaceae bacterium]|nr:HINT domain-containing protein [Marinifilaceae bacterium]